MHDLAARAAHWGVERAFTDALGHHREVEPEALARILNALAASGEDSAAAPRTIWRGEDRTPLILSADTVRWRLRDEGTRIVAEGAGEG
ncbi:MAG: hypothetical protein AB7U47_12650, partial [Variibacter sp.]